MCSKFVRTGLAVLGIAFSPLAADAAVYEAVWQVQIVSADSYGLSFDFSRPTSFEYKVRFSDEVWYVEADEAYPFSTMTYFSQDATIHNRPAVDYLPARPSGTRSAYNSFYGHVADEEWEFSETVDTTAHEIIQDGDLYWEHSTYLKNTRYSDTRSGVGEDDYAMTSESMISFLEAVMADPGAFKLEYYEYFSHSIGSSSLYYAWWLGDMQLVSLHELDTVDVPEPPLMVLFGAGLLGLALFGRRRHHQPEDAC